jgi:4-azaleucine resistance transporter AzlC
MTAGPSAQSAVTGAGVTLGLAVGIIGLSFGVGAVSAGASVWQACAMSLLVFTGASQLSAVSVIAAGGSFGAALGGAVLLAARNGVYGLAMSGVLRGSLVRRLVAAQITIDESTAMAAAQGNRAAAERAFWVTGASVYVFWNLGTLVGALAGSAVDPQQFGLDAAFPAAFVGMIAPLLARRRDRLAAALGAGICLVTLPVLPVGLPILAAATAVLVGVRRP